MDKYKLSIRMASGTVATPRFSDCYLPDEEREITAEERVKLAVLAQISNGRREFRLQLIHGWKDVDLCPIMESPRFVSIENKKGWQKFLTMNEWVDHRVMDGHEIPKFEGATEQMEIWRDDYVIAEAEEDKAKKGIEGQNRHLFALVKQHDKRLTNLEEIQKEKVTDEANFLKSMLKQDEEIRQLKQQVAFLIELTKGKRAVKKYVQCPECANQFAEMKRGKIVCPVGCDRK